ncbi:MAG: hypothetical protein IJS32_01225 [Kiritimatiellae bacterium]|nr:hypothetical protein [Kiritimatiellia bacterium]
MTAERSAASFFTSLLAGALLAFSAGCGFDGEDDEWVVGGSGSSQSDGSAAQSQSTDRNQSSQNQSGTAANANQTAAKTDTGNGGNAAGGNGTGNGGTTGGTNGQSNAGTGTDDSDPSGTGDSGTPSADSADSVPFSALKWRFGHFGGSRAKLSSPQLANLRCSGNTLSYKWVTGLSGWGLSNGEAGAIAAAFVQKEDGSWVGGKFDWVSTSRSSRGLENVLSGYEGWTLSGVPNPCQICFVVVDVSGRRRSNVIGPATWSR